MTDRATVLLVTGPGASGKSTLAQAVAAAWGWVALSEDEYWVRNGWGWGLRSVEQERVVQAQVAGDLLVASRAGAGVVLEFILYKPPPNPLTAYQALLSEHALRHRTIVLKPSVEEILRRTQERGRPRDVADLAARRRDAESQVRLLEWDVDPAWVVDPTGRTVEDLVEECEARVRRRA